MAALAGSLYLVSTIAFCGVCLVIGVRLLLRARASGARPEGLLGLGLGLTGGVGYGTLIAVVLLRQALGDAPHPVFTWATALGKAAHDVGVMCMLGFVLAVFRPGVAWARILAGAMIAILWTGYAAYAAGGHFVHGRPEGFWYWLEFLVIGTYPLWGAFEALRFHAQMRRRRALGLADPLVTNRFLLWGVGSLLALAAIWTISLPAILGMSLDEQRRVAPAAMLATALWGCGCIGAYWLTFFPPRWYRARVAAGVS
jgi:hypothetical protein